MKYTLGYLLPPVLVLAGLAVSCLLLWRQTERFRQSVETIAHDVRVSLIGLDGKVVYDSTGQDLPNHADRVEFEAVRADGRARSVVRTSETLHMDMFYHARRVGDYVLRIAVPYPAVTDAKAGAIRGMAAAAGTGALIILALVVFMRRYERRLLALAAERDVKTKLLDEFQKLEHFRRDFISNVTHEIKTPVTGLLGAVELLTDETSVLEPADRAELRHVVESQSARLNALVEDILALARLEQAQTRPRTDFAPCDLADIIQTAINLAQPAAQQAHVEISFTRASVVRPCDVRLVESAVTNLLQNALRYSGSATIDVGLAPAPDGRGVITVTDHGIGIPEACQARLFERFYRVDKDRSRALGGTGLGLAIVKHIAQLHGGEVRVSSRPAAGATFTLII